MPSHRLKTRSTRRIRLSQRKSPRRTGSSSTSCPAAPEDVADLVDVAHDRRHVLRAPLVAAGIVQDRHLHYATSARSERPLIRRHAMSATVADQLVVAHPGGASGLREAGVVPRVGQDARQRVQFDDHRAIGGVAADVDAAPVAAFERAIGRQGGGADVLGQRFAECGPGSRRSPADAPASPTATSLRSRRWAARPWAACQSLMPTMGRQRASSPLPSTATVNSGPGR